MTIFCHGTELRHGRSRIACAPLRALVEGQQATVEALRAEAASLTDRNHRLQEQSPEALVEDLRARVVSLTERNRNPAERNRRLEHLVRELRRAIYAKKSEKLHRDQLLLAFEELEGALAERTSPSKS